MTAYSLSKLACIISFFALVKKEGAMDKATFEGFFTSLDLHECTKSLYKSSNKPEKEANPETSDLRFQCHIQQEKIDCLAGLDLDKNIMYAFAKNNAMDCEIKIVLFQKKYGIKKSMSLSGINGPITAIALTLFRDEEDNGSESSKSKKLLIKLVFGSKDGFLKAIDLTDGSISGLRLDAKPMISIISGDYFKFHKRNICIVLADDHCIHFVDIKKMKSIGLFRPSIVTCERPLSIEINHQYTYLMQTTRQGYIIFWKLNKIIDQLQLSAIQQTSRKPKSYNLIASRVNHSVALDGLIACLFYGNIIALITKKGLLRLVVLSLKADQEFMVLSEYQISHPESITSVCIYPQHDCIIVSKSQSEGNSYLQKLVIGEELNVCKRIRIPIKEMDAINSFYLAPGSSILMCRGDNCIGIGFNGQLFEQSRAPSEVKREMDRQDY